MAPPNNVERLEYEGRLVLALQALERKTVHTLRDAERTFNVHYSTLRDRYYGVASRRDCEPNRKKLTRLEEDTSIRYILDLDVRGFSPILAEVADMANKLLKARGIDLVGINWPS